MLDLIQKHFGDGQVIQKQAPPPNPHPLLLPQNRARSYMLDLSSCIRFGSTLPKKAWVMLCTTSQGHIWMAWSQGHIWMAWILLRATSQGHIWMAWILLCATSQGHIWMVWSGCGQAHLVQTQAGVQESPGLVSDRMQPRRALLVSHLQARLPSSADGLDRTERKPAQVRFGSG